MVFVHEKNKKTVYVTYKFDYDFNQISVNEEELSLSQAAQKYDWIEYEEGEGSWTNPTVVRIDGTAFHAGQVVLRRGKITRKWATDYYQTSGVSYTTHTWVGYWKYKFEEIEQLKPKIEIPVELDPRAPKFVVNMVQSAAKKIALVAYATDEPAVEVTTGARSFNPRSKAQPLTQRTREYSAASGNLVLVGRQMYAVKDEYFNRYVALKYSAADFSLLNQTLIPVDYGVDTIYTQILPDKSIIFIVAPLPAVYVKPGKPHSNPRAFTYFRVDKDANLKERIEFESPSSRWNIHNINLQENGDIYIYGEASKEKNDKYYVNLQTAKVDNFQLMKISNGKMEYITSTPVADFAKKLQLPANVKKVEPYTGKKSVIGELTVTSAGEILISSQENDEGKFGNITLFHFGTDGKLKAQYGYKLAETNKDATSQPTLHVEFENPDGTLSWLVYEIAGVEGERMLMYPQMTTIDLQNAKISEVATFGVSKKAAYYIDNSHPIVPIDNYTKVVFFGTDKKDKVLWFARVGLSK